MGSAWSAKDSDRLGWAKPKRGKIGRAKLSCALCEQQRLTKSLLTSFLGTRNYDKRYTPVPNSTTHNTTVVSPRETFILSYFNQTYNSKYDQLVPSAQQSWCK